MKIERILQGQKRIKILSESDQHSGSVSALLPKSAVSFDGQIVTRKPQNQIQRWLWKNRLDDLSSIGKVDVNMNLGDTCEGQQLKIAGRTLVDSDTDNQVLWAIDNIQIALDICKPKYFLGVNGTPYHVRTSGSLDMQVYKALERKNPNIKFIYAENLIIQIGKLMYAIAHPFPTVRYKAPALEKLITQHATEYYLGNMPRIKVFPRGHAHVFNWLRYRGNIYAYVVPCQQPTSSYARNKAYLTVRRPDIGLLLTMQEDEDLIPRPFLHKWRR